jgi:NTE family protein
MEHSSSFKSEHFAKSPPALDILEQIRQKGLDRKIYSDITDAGGSQYVDLVQEGGGVLGIALTGYTWALEKCGIRFFSLAGSSAGAINTLLMAGLAPVGQAVSDRIINLMADKDFYDFIDGKRQIRKLIKRYIAGKPGFKLHVFLNAFLLWRTLRKYLGLNPGMEFELWLSQCIADNGIRSLDDLMQLRKNVPPLLDRSENFAAITRIPGLQIITSEITTKSKVVFPEMAELYWHVPEKVNPVKFVRASMSIPYFFFPFTVRDIPGSGSTGSSNAREAAAKWRKHAGYYGEIPERVHFIDGGLLSNFPINAFHLGSGIPKKPTFGVKLSAWRKNYSVISDPGKMTAAMVSAMRQLHDYDFLLKNPDYNSLICYIDADEKFNWLDFSIGDEEKVKLFHLGAQKAVDFLEKFDWQEYKKLRSKPFVFKPI